MCDVNKLKELQQLYTLQNYELLKSKKAVEWQTRLAFFQVVVGLGIVILIVLVVVLKRIEMQRAYQDFITFVDTDPTIGGVVSGMKVVFYYFYPNLFTNPFLNKNFPAAAIYSYYTVAYQPFSGDDFMTLYSFSQLYGNYSALELICNSYGAKRRIAQCDVSCKGPSISNARTITTSAASMGGSFAMAAGSFAPPGTKAVATVVAFLVGSGVGALTGWLSSRESTERCQASSIHCTKNVC